MYIVVYSVFSQYVCYNALKMKKKQKKQKNKKAEEKKKMKVFSEHTVNRR